MDKRDLLIEQWKIAHELHKHEDNLTWQKFNYFIAVNGILLSVLVASWKDLVIHPLNLKFVGASISVFGTLISGIWFLAQWRGQLYQTFRIKQAKKAEEDLAKIDGEQVLDLYRIGLNDKAQRLVKVWLPARIPIQILIVGLAGIMTVGWCSLLVGFLSF